MESETTHLLTPEYRLTGSDGICNVPMCIVNVEPEVVVNSGIGTDGVNAEHASVNDFEDELDTGAVSRKHVEVDMNSIMETLLKTRNNRQYDDGINLPEGKEAHLFVSYSNEDKERVLPVVAELEEKFNLACIIHERDFKAGREIQANITKGMEESIKILLFLSKNFLQSSYCRYEENVAFVMSMQTGANIIIPVMLEECQVPSALKTLTYIAADTTNLAERIAEAYRNNDTDALPADFKNVLTKLENGYCITLPSEVEKSCIPFRSSSIRAILKGNTKDYIKAGKFKVSDDAIEEAIDIVNLYTSKGWLASGICMEIGLCMCSWFFILLVFSVIWGLLGLAVYSKEASQRTAIIQLAFIITLPVVSTICLFVMFCLASEYSISKSKKEFQLLEKELFNSITLNTWDDGVMFKVTTNFLDEVHLCLIRYDTKPCQKYIADKLKKLEEQNSEEQTTNMTEYDTLAKVLLRDELRWLLENNAPDAPETRHVVKGGKACFCQRLEAGDFIKT